MERNDAFGDDVYQPQADGALDHTGELDMEDALGEPNADDLLDSGYSPPEKPRVCGRYGTTGEEQRRGESLEERMRQEEPEAGLGDGEEPDEEYSGGNRRAGRLMFMDTGGVDGDSWHMVGRDVGIDGGAASAEEAAMHIMEEPVA
ncbi:MAG: hypothetical protein CSA58_09430 [Micrococcales bacterium]|nr:MAG: hypothetical protein CSB46_03305 [Micrococcales bacterium]PIE26448.1 MAG: hypothetical protein CSA58_09430 [Micrococcales bacterium]